MYHRQRLFHLYGLKAEDEHPDCSHVKVQGMENFTFLPRDAMLEQHMLWPCVCLSVCLCVSVLVSVTGRSSTKMA